MEAKILSDVPARTDEEYKREADRLMSEIRMMLSEAGRNLERARRTGSENRRTLDELEQRLSCGKNSSAG